MSTHTGKKKRATGRQWDALKPVQGKMPIYRCLYCRKRVHGGRTALPSHEAQCDMRLTVRRQWALNIEKFIRRQGRH